MLISPAQPRPTKTEIDLAYSRYSGDGLVWSKARRATLRAFWSLASFAVQIGKRVLDFVVALMILALLSPWLLLAAALLRSEGKAVLVRQPRIGRWGVEFQSIEFNPQGRVGKLLSRLGLQRLPLLVHVLRGEMALVGPRALTPGEPRSTARAAWKRSSIRPGLLSLWWLRKQANIDFGEEISVDLEYVDRQSVKADLGIVLRSLPAMLYGSAAAATAARIEVLGIPIDNLTMSEALDGIMGAARGGPSLQLCFVNTDCANKAQHDPAYAELLRRSNLVLGDGIGIRLAAKIHGQHVRQNVNGTDLFPLLCQRLQGSGLGLFLLGGQPGVSESVSEWIAKNYPEASVKGCHHGFFYSV